MQILQYLYHMTCTHSQEITKLGLVLFLFLVCILLLRKNQILKRQLNDSEYYRKAEHTDAELLFEKNEKLTEKYKSTSYTISRLQREVNNLSRQNANLQESLDATLAKYNNYVSQIQNEKLRREKNRQDYLKREENEKTERDSYIDLANQKLEFNPGQLIRLRTKVFMNEEESRKYYHICEELKDEAYIHKYGTNHIRVFAQVALHSIFERTKMGIELDEHIKDTHIRRFFLSKSVDFLVCAAHYDKDNHYYEYKPILGIEIDGKYHDDPEVRERDEQKERLFNAVGIPFLRFSLEENKNDKTAIRNKIRKLLL